jgi:hypothetical protein
VERLFFAPFAWAKAVENAPEPSSAIKAPTRHKTQAIKKRRLKNPPSPRLRRAGAHFEVDFFFMDVVLFSLCSEPEIVVKMLGEMDEVCK